MANASDRPRRDKGKRRIQINITDAETGDERGTFDYVVADDENGGFTSCTSCTLPWPLFVGPAVARAGASAFAPPSFDRAT